MGVCVQSFGCRFRARLEKTYGPLNDSETPSKTLRAPKHGDHQSQTDHRRFARLAARHGYGLASLCANTCDAIRGSLHRAQANGLPVMFSLLTGFTFPPQMNRAEAPHEADHKVQQEDLISLDQSQVRSTLSPSSSYLSDGFPRVPILCVCPARQFLQMITTSKQSTGQAYRTVEQANQNVKGAHQIAEQANQNANGAIQNVAQVVRNEGMLLFNQNIMLLVICGLLYLILFR